MEAKEKKKKEDKKIVQFFFKQYNFGLKSIKFISKEYNFYSNSATFIKIVYFFKKCNLNLTVQFYHFLSSFIFFGVFCKFFLFLIFKIFSIIFFVSPHLSLSLYHNYCDVVGVELAFSDDIAVFHLCLNVAVPQWRRGSRHGFRRVGGENGGGAVARARACKVKARWIVSASVSASASASAVFFGERKNNNNILVNLLKI